MHVLAEIDALDPVGSSRETLRLCTGGNRALSGHDGNEWWPAITAAPTFKIDLFDGAFLGDPSVAAGTMRLRLDVIAAMDANAPRYVWAGAEVRIWTWADGTATQIATAKITRFSLEDYVLSLTFDADTEPFEVDVLTEEYAGTTGLEGGADLKGRVKPWLFGRALNVEPVLIDLVNNVYQVSAYGPIEAVNAVYERGADFGASLGDYGSYASLVAATVPEGTWATCLADGLFRLGAPAYGVITADVDGDNTGSTWRRLTGAILTHIASQLSITAIDTSSLAALDTAVPYNVNLYLTEQTTFLDLARRLVRPCNAVAGPSLMGELFVSRIAFDTPSLTLDAQGRQMPPVLGMGEQTVSPPFKRIMLGAQRSWRVHSYDEIAFYAPLIDMGEYDATTVYREGNIVSYLNRRWLYTSTTPSSGNAPSVDSAYWSEISGNVTYRGGDVAANPRLGDILYGEGNQPFRYEGEALTFDGEPITFDGEPITVPGWVSVRDQSLESVIATLQSYDNDGILTVVEKRSLIQMNRQLTEWYRGIIERAADLGLSGEPVITDAAAAWTAYLAYRDSLDPAWNDTSQPTEFVSDEWDGLLDGVYQTFTDADTALTGSTGVEVIPPADQVVLLDSSGAIATGEYPRTLTPTVKRGGVDIRDDDDVTYAITPTGITATINNTQGDADKGKITATAGSSGSIALTVTVAGIDYDFTIRFGPDAEDDFGSTTDGYYERRTKRNGTVLLEQWGSKTCPANGTVAVSFPVEFADLTYSVGLSGAEPAGTNDQDNYPNIDMGTKATTGFTVSNSDDSATEVNWRAIGVEIAGT